MHNGTMRDMTRWCAVSGGLHATVCMILVICAGERVLHRLPHTVIDVELRDLPHITERRVPAPAARNVASAVPAHRNVAPPSHPPAAVEVPRFVAPVTPAVPVAEIAPTPAVPSPAMTIPAPVREAVRSQPSPPVPVPAPAPARPAQPDSGAARARYLAVVRGMIEKFKEYPVMARRGRMEGTVVVRFVLVRSGVVREAAVIRSSGSGLLDAAALRAVRSAGGFPPVPAEIAGSDITMEVPLIFRLVGT